jgi:hypothetical protein
MHSILLHLISAPDQPGRKQLYHYKSLLSKYIYSEKRVSCDHDQIDLDILNKRHFWLNVKLGGKVKKSKKIYQTILAITHNFNGVKFTSTLDG